MQIQKLDKTVYAGRKFTAQYRTNGYYAILPSESGFEMRYTAFESTVEKSFDDAMLSEWLDDPTAFGAFEDGRLIGYVEGFLEKWNNRYRISNICIFDFENRRRGLGQTLMETILREAESTGARMAILETQTCNENAIAFYRRNGFEIIGFDLYAYSNEDPERREVRIEMGKRLNAPRACS